MLAARHPLLPPKLTYEVARMLGVTTTHLYSLVRRKAVAPIRDGRGRYLWYVPDVEQARQAIAGQADGPIPPQAQKHRSQQD